ncbi:hypothetical protein C8Q77DRAFT_408357 [Trametes polyzona]|nr:hypothetical protein C8Q77DRAFT_408357 [Trametes polyzona]
MSAPGPWRDAAPAPRAPYPPFPPVPPPPLADHPFAGASRQSYYAAPLPGFYSPALAQPAPGLARSPPARGAPPAFPRPELPQSLMPGGKPTFNPTRTLSDDYFFQADGPSSPPAGYYRQTRPSLSSPPVPRKPDFSNPPLPPKPRFSPPASAPAVSRVAPSSSPPLPYGRAPRAVSYPPPEHAHHPPPEHHYHHQASAPPLPPAAPHEDDAVLHHVLEISAQESKRQQEESMRSEETQLAMALAASLRMGSSQSTPEADGRSSFITSSPEQGPSSLPAHSLGPVLDISRNSIYDVKSRRSRADSHVEQQIMDDEALALQLAQEEERLAAEQERRPGSQEASAHSRSPSQVTPTWPAGDGLPQYAEAVTSPAPLVASPGIYEPTLSPQLGVPIHSGPSSPQSALGRSVSEKPVPPRSPVVDQKRVSRSQSVGESGPSSSTSLLTPSPHISRPGSAKSSEWEPPEETALTPSSVSSHTSDVPSQTQYLDAELLMGLCECYVHVASHCMLTRTSSDGFRDTYHRAHP